MARQAQSQAQSTFNAAKGFGNTADTNSQQLYGQLFPELSTFATNPPGYSPGDLSAINTAGQQSTGGAVASARGEGDLRVARTRNSAGQPAADEEAVRDAMRTNSENAEGVQEANANLKQRQIGEGLSGEQSLYGTNTNDVLSSLGLENQSTNTLTNAGNSGWFQNLLGAINAVSGAGKSAASLGAHF